MEIILSDDLILDLVGHGVLAIPLCFIFWKKTKKWTIALMPFLVTYAIDFDHLIDYWGYYGFGFNLSDFLRMDYFLGVGSAFVPLHAWEWILILLPICLKKGWDSIITAITLGGLVHLLVDAVMVNSLLFYSITYRYLLGFRIFL